MAKKAFIDTRALCWRAMLIESKNFNNSFFSLKHCSEEETRDTNFDIVENRLAYMYRFGIFNVLFVQKCVASFLENYPEGETLFKKENLKICSLSNGPGFDLVGMLLALYECNQHLESFPVLKTISLYNSWWNVCKTMVYDVFEAAGEHSHDSFAIPAEIIHFIQHDIYATLSPDVEECIKDSDILLMVKVFASTKAVCDIVMKSMQEIFSLLKPGSFVFFVGSKKNTKEVTENSLLKKYVSCILGPVKISLKDIPIEEAVVKAVGIKPKDSGCAYFVVWQKESVSQEEISKKKKKNRRKKKKSKVQKQLTDMTTVSKEITDDIDESSDTTLSSHSRHSETSDESKSASHENTSQSISPVAINIQNTDKENLSQEDLLLSVDGITSFLDKIHINSDKENITETGNIHESGKGNIYNLETNIQGEFVKKQVAVQSENPCVLYNEISSNQTVDAERVLTTVSHEQEAQLLEESNFCVLTHGPNRELNVEQKYILPEEDYSTCLLDKKNILLKLSDEESVQETELHNNLPPSEIAPDFKENIQEKRIEMSSIAQADIICSPGRVKQVEERDTTAKQGEDDVLKKVICDEASMSNSSSRKSSINTLHEVNDAFKTIIQNMDAKKKDKNDITNEESVQDTQLLHNLPPASGGATTFMKNIQARKIEIPIIAQADNICSPSKAKEVMKMENIAKQGEDYLVLKKVKCDEASTSNPSSKNSSINVLHEVNDTLKTVIQTMNSKILGKKHTADEESVQDIQLLHNLSACEIASDFKKNILAKQIEIPVVAHNISSTSKVKQAKERDTTTKQCNDLVLKKAIFDEASTSNSKSRNSSINKLSEATLSAVTENMNAKKLVKNNAKKVPLSKETPVINDKNKDLNHLLQRCESLVTSLEKLTESLKSSITLNNDQNFRHCVRSSSCEVPHYCPNSCCISAVHSHCCSKGCNSQMRVRSSCEVPHYCPNSCCISAVHSHCCSKGCNSQMFRNST